MIKGSVISLALFLAYLTLPLFGLLPGVLAPAAGIFFFLKGGRWVGYGIVAITVAVLAVYDPASVVVYLLQCGILTLAVAEFLCRNKGGSRSIVYAVAINVVVMAAAAVVFSVATGSNIHQQVAKGIHNSIAQTAALYGKAGVGADELKTLRQAMEQAGDFITRTYPALITVSLGFIVGLNILVLKRLAARFSLPLQTGEFKRFKNPDQLVWVLIAAGFAMLVDNDMVALPALNVLIVLLSAYFIQGMAVMAHAFGRFAVPFFVRLIFYLLLSLQPFLTLVVAALGIFDLWGDFRTPKNKENL
jgi:uncharacterized protein YybS (DUF2232 family)